jgi:hypothetical protein
MQISLEDAKKIVYSFGKKEYWDEMLSRLINVFKYDVLEILKSMDRPAPEKPDYNYLMEFENQYQNLRKVFVKPYLEVQELEDEVFVNF